MPAKAITNKAKNVVPRSLITFPIEMPNHSFRIVCTSKIGNLSEQVGGPRGLSLYMAILRFSGGPESA